MTRKGVRLFIAAGLAASVACTVHQSDVPSVAGPSELAHSLNIVASPDKLTQDGRSSSTITITARDANGEPAPNVQLHLETMIANQIVQFGSLSASTVSTNSAGRASATYITPSSSPFLAGGPSQTVSIAATPIGTNSSLSSWSYR